MSATFKFDWGQEVRVVATAPLNTRPGQAGSVCGMREQDRKLLYLIEFSDGEAIEIMEEFLDRVKDA
jgi:hypothetical protein